MELFASVAASQIRCDVLQDVLFLGFHCEPLGHGVHSRPILFEAHVKAMAWNVKLE